jgi:hypothetical protein
LGGWAVANKICHVDMYRQKSASGTASRSM